MQNNNFSLGALFSVPDLRDYVGKSTLNDFPEKFELELTAVKNQQNVGSCVAHAVASVAEYFNKVETGKVTKLSTGYIYGNRLLSFNKGVGLNVRDTLKTMTKFGDVEFEVFPENIEVPQAIALFDERYNELETSGAQYKFDKYFRIKDENTLKQQLITGNPVLISMWWFDDIEIVDGVMKTNCIKSKNTGGHCMVVYGWNEDGWLVQNSWGSSWGNNGKFVLPYDVSVKEFWGVTDENSDSTLEIITPFSSSIGKAFAKTVHAVLRWIFKVFNIQ